MPLDHYVTLGRSGLRVSPMCLGAMTFGAGDAWGVRDAAEADALMDLYAERGGNFIDTANIYGGGRSEEMVGAWLGKSPGRRRRTVLATKFSSNFFPGDPNGGGAGRKSIVAACEDSLRRLKTEVIDLYWLHWEDPHTPIEETMRALDDLVRAGMVVHVGFSDISPWKVAQAQMVARYESLTPVIALQIEYSLLERTIEAEFPPLAAEMGMSIVPWSPLKSGVLSGKYRRGVPVESGRQWIAGGTLPDRHYDVIEAAAAVAERHGVLPAQVALAWVGAKPGVASPIIGARRLSQLEENLGALDLKLTAEDMAALDLVSAPILGFPASIFPVNRMLAYGGLTINGESYPALQLS
ncbi:MAG TPA: aldo/keto reductase [Stellaceae bacterium]|nr:aldo/keto reductase [Stellaceae bacterium]